jgi:hypothetical protein
MTRRAFTPSQIARAAKIACETGAEIVLEAPDGARIRLAPAPPAAHRSDPVEEFFASYANKTQGRP